jgi:hypothetical protein
MTTSTLRKTRWRGWSISRIMVLLKPSRGVSNTEEASWGGCDWTENMSKMTTEFQFKAFSKGFNSLIQLFGWLEASEF